MKINFGLGETFLISKDDYYDSKPLNDLEWHHVHLERIDRKLLLKIDSTRTYWTQINGFHHSNGLKIQYGIYLGSQHGLKSLYLGDIRPLRGCIDQIYFNGQNLFDLIDDDGKHQVINHEVNFDQKCDEQFDPSNIIINDDDDSDNETIVTISYVHHHYSYLLLPGLFNYISDNNNIKAHNSPQINGRTNLSVQFDLKSTSSNAMVIFVAGKNPYRKEFFAIEIIGKRLKVSINDGNGELNLHSNIIIADSHWHHVEILLTSMIDTNQLTTIVDGQHESTSTKLTWQLFRSSSSKLSSELYLGGLSVERQSLAINYGLESTLITSNVSLKGCIRNVRINSVLINIIRDAIVTRNILVGNHCRWQFLCHNDDPEKRPCIAKAKCNHEQLNLIKCSCQNHHHHHNNYRHWPDNNNSPSCVRKYFKHKSIIIESINDVFNSSEAVTNEFLPDASSVSCDGNSGEILVNEGTTTEINSALSDILINANILSSSDRNNNIFDVVVAKKPDYGSINLDQLTIDINSLSKQPIRYTHIISGKTRDSMSIELVKRQSSFIHVQCDRYLVKIIFKINPPLQQQQQNDVAAVIDSNKQSIHRIQLKILANTNFPLTPSLFKLSDLPISGRGKNSKKKDDHHHHRFKVMSIDPVNHGYFARINQKNYSVKIENFTENDLRNESIVFVHEKNSMEKNASIPLVKCVIIYRDNNKERFELTFKPYDLADNRSIINTGLLMAHHSYALITASNLSLIVSDNLEKQDKNLGQIIRFEMETEPVFGVVQKLRLSPNNWLNVTQFTQRQLDRGKIRYLHLNDFPDSDRFFVKVMFQKQLIDRGEVIINFVQNLQLQSYGSNIYNFSRNEKEFIITKAELAYQTRPVLSDTESIRYRLRSVPSYGTLYSLANDAWQRKLGLDSQFSQKDVDERRIFYVRNNSFVNIDSLRDLVDSFSYDVIVSNVTDISTF